MADICNLSYQELSTIAGNYIRLETLREANDHLANANTIHLQMRPIGV